MQSLIFKLIVEQEKGLQSVGVGKKRLCWSHPACPRAITLNEVQNVICIIVALKYMRMQNLRTLSLDR
jgi:hypothetical protein